MNKHECSGQTWKHWELDVGAACRQHIIHIVWRVLSVVNLPSFVSVLCSLFLLLEQSELKQNMGILGCSWKEGCGKAGSGRSRDTENDSDWSKKWNRCMHANSHKLNLGRSMSYNFDAQHNFLVLRLHNVGTMRDWDRRENLECQHWWKNYSITFQSWVTEVPDTFSLFQPTSLKIQIDFIFIWPIQTYCSVIYLPVGQK